MSSKPKSETRQRSKQVPVRFSETEYAELEQRALNAKMSKASFLRSRALETAPPRQRRVVHPNQQVLALLLGRMGSIGNNINQVAKLAHQRQWPQDEALQQAVADIVWIREQFTRLFDP